MGALDPRATRWGEGGWGWGKGKERPSPGEVGGKGSFVSRLQDLRRLSTWALKHQVFTVTARPDGEIARSLATVSATSLWIRVRVLCAGWASE